MKTNRYLAMLMALAITISLFVIPASATEAEEPHTHIEVYFEDETLSEEFKEKATAYFLNGATDENTAKYGLTCTLFGHKYETSRTTVTTHKARATSPRCLKNTYDYSSCTRCGYETSTLISSTYIVCC